MPEWSDIHQDQDHGPDEGDMVLGPAAGDSILQRPYLDVSVQNAQTLDLFNQAADAIVRAAQKFGRFTGEEGETFVPGLDDTSPVYKMPLAAYCLSMAQRLWRETQQLSTHREHCELRLRLQQQQAQAQSPPQLPAFPFGLFGGSMRAMPVEEFLNVMTDMTANLNDDQRQELISLLQAQNTHEECTEAPEPPEQS